MIRDHQIWFDKYSLWDQGVRADDRDWLLCAELLFGSNNRTRLPLLLLPFASLSSSSSSSSLWNLLLVRFHLKLSDPYLWLCCKYRINCLSLTWWIRPRSAIPEKKSGQMCTKSKKMSQNQKKWTRAETKWTRAKQLRRQVTDKCCLPVARKCTFCHQELSKPFPSPPGAEKLCPLCDHYKLSNNVLYEMSKPFQSPAGVAHLRRLSDVQYRYKAVQQFVITN